MGGVPDVMQLRPDQAAAIEGVRDAYRKRARAVVLQAPTGFGKTFVAAHCIRSSVSKGYRVVFAAHLDALIDDTSERLSRAGIEHGIVQGDRPTNPTAPVQVCSLATLHRRGNAPPADLVILDECHRALAASVKGTLERYPEADLLGLTATPQRGDGQPLGDVFQALVQGPPMRELVALGALVPAHVISPEQPTDGALARDPVEALEEFAPGAPSMVFCRDAEHAELVAAQIGVRAVVILGETSRALRREARERIVAGEPLVLVGCGVFVEGWDSPEIRAVVLARTFGVCGSYLQACGRGLRPAKGKTHCTVIDLVGAAVLHGLPEDDRVWSLSGEPYRTGDALIALVRCKGCFAVMHRGPAKCSRCGASLRGCQVKRRATRVERQELSRLDTRPLHVRDEIAMRALVARMPRTGKKGQPFSESARLSMARYAFKKSHGRWPEVKAS